MFLMTSLNAISRTINKMNSVINITPFLQGVRTTAAVPYYMKQYITYYARFQVYNMHEF